MQVELRWEFIMDASAPRVDMTGTTAPAGYRHFHPDVSLNFQCNRWVEMIGPTAIEEVSRLAARANAYPEWIDGFLALADQACAADRTLAAACYARAAEFFMTADDTRRIGARARFVQTMHVIYDVAPEYIPFGSGAMPVYDLRPERQIGSPIILFGGFDSYIEDLLPIAAAMVDVGRRIIAFEGPGQGGAFEDHGLPMIADWERPVAAVLDHYALQEVTAIGLSLGGGLVIRAAAFEPRITRVVAWGVVDDLFDVAAGQLGSGPALVLRALLRLGARRVINAVAGYAMSKRPVAQWGLQRGMHITGTATPFAFLHWCTQVSTKRIAHRITGDVLLLAGADDHYIPLKTLWSQAATLTRARSLTTRTFTADQQASNHCQIGNTGAAARVIHDWLKLTENSLPEPIDSGDPATTIRS